MKKSPIRRKSKTPLAQAKQKLWELCREITRIRYGNTCYTCGKTGLEGSNYQTGHFITKSTCSAELAYDLSNLAVQCYHCNINLSGSWVKFEAHLRRDGIDVEALKRRNEATKGLKYDISWYTSKIEEYEKILHV